MKDSVTSRLPAHESDEGIEASGSSRHPIIPKFKFARSSIAGDVGTEDVEKMAFVPKKTEQKGKLSMDPMVESSRKSTNYSASVEESISLVGKSMGMPRPTSRGFAP